MGNRLEQILEKRDYSMPNSHIKKFSISLIIKEMKIKAQFYQHTHQMSKIFNNQKITSVIKDVKKRQLS